MLRLFIGIGLPQSYQDALRPFTDSLGKDLSSKVGWTRPGIWHLTLKFLGDTDEGRVPAIADALDAIELPAFTMQAGGAGVFPRIQHPRVVWLGLKQGAEQCAELAMAIEDSLDAIGIAREKKQFRPHLTLGRVRKLAKDNWQGVVDVAAARAWPEFTAKAFTLWQSDLRPTGAVHTPIRTFRLS